MCASRHHGVSFPTAAALAGPLQRRPLLGAELVGKLPKALGTNMLAHHDGISIGQQLPLSQAD
jgi:hypothetical protein